MLITVRISIISAKMKAINIIVNALIIRAADNEFMFIAFPQSFGLNPNAPSLLSLSVGSQKFVSLIFTFSGETKN